MLDYLEGNVMAGLHWESPSQKRQPEQVDPRTKTHRRIDSVKASLYLAARSNYGSTVRPCRESGMVNLRKPITGIVLPRSSRQIQAAWAVRDAQRKSIATPDYVINKAKAWRW